MSNVCISHKVFYLFQELSAIFIQFEIVICKLFEVGIIYNLLFGKWLNKKKDIAFIFSLTALRVNSKVLSKPCHLHRLYHHAKTIISLFLNNKSMSSKLKKFADNNFKFDGNGIKFSNSEENTVGKEIARFKQFLLFPQFLAPPAVGQRAYVMAHCLSSVCVSVLVLTFL